jgi:hypothetical protein
VSGLDALRPVTEDPGISTNNAAQTGLSIIEVLELCKDQLPTEVPAHRTGARPSKGN